LVDLPKCALGSLAHLPLFTNDLAGTRARLPMGRHVTQRHTPGIVGGS
jgi:hypothetical protein